ncbi:alpha/beta fold hydrolase [Paenibacillus marinisediminis]
MLWLFILLILIGLTALLLVYNRIEVNKAEQAYPPIGQFVEVEGVKLHYVSKGEGKPIVFLHGGILSVHDYLSVVDAASRHYHAIAFDRPGYGYSERPAHEPATPDVQARLIRGALKNMGIENPILVGHSMSGALVMAYALNYAEEIDGIVLLGAAVYGGKAYPAGDGDPLSRMVNTPVIGHWLLYAMLIPLGRMMMDSMLKATFSPDPVPDDYRQVTTALWLRPGQFKANREDILFFSPYVNSVYQCYKQIQLPVTIVIGDSDPFNKQEQSYRLHQEIKGSRLIELPNSGHMIPQIHPEAVLEAISVCIEDTNNRNVKID